MLLSDCNSQCSVGNVSDRSSRSLIGCSPIAHCPRCQSGARDRWLAKLARDLLTVPYCHVVFTLPGQLAPLAFQNARLIYNLLFQAASEALLTIAADPKRMGARVGFLAVLHTWNQKLHAEPSLMMPVITISCVFSEQKRLILRSVPL